MTTHQRVKENFHRIQAHAQILTDIQAARDAGRTPQESWRVLEDRARRLDAEIIAFELADLERATTQDQQERTCKFFNL